MCPYEFRTQVPSCDLCWSKNRPPSRLVNGSGPARRPSTSGLCSLVSKMRRPFSEQQRSKVGFPIRKFSDQSLFAAPRNLSQRTTSFIASQRQGIRRIPFRHLIVLEIRKRTVHSERCCASRKQETRLGRRVSILFLFEKTSFASNASGDLSGQAPNPRLVARETR